MTIEDLSPLIRLVMTRIQELGQQVKDYHYNLEKWRDPALTAIQRTEMGVKLGHALDEQFAWASAIETLLEEGKT